MNRFRCQVKCCLLFFSGLLFLGLAGTVMPVNAGEPKDNTKLEKWLRGMNNEKMLLLGGDSALPDRITDLYDYREQLNNALIKEFARRLEAPKTDPAGAAKVKGKTAAFTKPGASVKVDGKIAIKDLLAPAEVHLEDVTAEAFLGEPFSIGSLKLKFTSGNGPVIYPDQQLFFDAIGERAHFKTFDVTYQRSDNEPTMMVDRIHVLFLIRGPDTCQVSLSSVEGALLDKREIEPIQDDIRHRELLREWWSQFSVIPTSYGREQRELKQSLLDILARRLKLPGPWPSVTQTDDAANESSLEHQFERGIGMLFGIESVTLAMQTQATLNQMGRFEKADQPIPAFRPFESVTIPPVPQGTWIEPIAMHVPAECFYLRTGGLANYRQFRQFLLGWGGSLNDIVSNGAVDHNSRERIEGQLGLSPDNLFAETFDPLIADMALIGFDPMFDEGASVGILFQARQSVELALELANVIKEHRHQARSRVPDSEEKRVTIEGQDVSFLTSSDNRIRSFYAIKGEYHLVTNSQRLVSRFIQASNGTNSLGGLNEYRYARRQTNQISQNRMKQEPLAMLYLSDPFFQNMIGPRFRIELTRRRQAAEELKQYQLALMMAKSERVDATNRDKLIELKFLPSGFGTRPDASYPILERGNLRDSLRGAPGYFTPIADAPPRKATQSEVTAYQQFISEYSAKWRKIDPVTVVFSSDRPDGNGLTRVGLDIVITPYAREHYSTLRDHLAAPNDLRVARLNDDLVSLDTSIRSGQHSHSSHLLYLGLRDDVVPFVLKHGEIELVNGAKGASYAKGNSYAAISPPSTDMLKLLATVFNRVQRKNDQANGAEPQPKASSTSGGGGMSVVGLVITGLIIKNDNVLKDALQHLMPIASSEGWTVASLNRSLREDVLQKIATERVNSSPQVRLRVGSLSNSKVEPYIQAHTYLASRRTSYENARFLNDVSEWLQLPPKDSRDSIETVLGTQLRCPLGGDFQLSSAEGHSYWTGTGWPQASLFTETNTPESWTFSFLDWLRGLELQFNLDQTTLRANINLLGCSRLGNVAFHVI